MLSMVTMLLAVVTVVVVVLVQSPAAVTAFYLPGVAPVDYPDGAAVALKVTSMTSTKTQLPFEYYTLPFCRPPAIKRQIENLGEVLRGDRIMNSPYALFMKMPDQCQSVCAKQKYSAKQINQFIHRIKDDYRVHWIIDNLPAATPHSYQAADSDIIYKSYTLGFPVGTVVADEIDTLDDDNNNNNNNNNKENEEIDNNNNNQKAQYFLNNHVTITVLYHDERSETETAGAAATLAGMNRKKDQNGDVKRSAVAITPGMAGSRIVGVEVLARSIRHKSGKDGKPICTEGDSMENMPRLELSVGVPDEFFWTYDVVWTETTAIKWASRWDTYLYMSDDNIHWLAVMNSIMIVLFLTGMIAMILMRTVQQEITKYNQLDDSDDLHEETGWKLVHADVFRPPPFPMLLSVSVGMGVQVSGMALVTLLFACLGFLSPANRGGLLTAMVLLFCLMGFPGGYYSARNYKMFKEQAWKRNVAMTAFFYPGIIFAVLFVLNFFIWGAKSSGAVPFGTLLALLYLWLGLCTPLVMLGAYFGYKKKIVEHPVRTNQIPRQIPDNAWYVQPATTIMLGAILPFGAIFIELFFILSSIWLHTFYYLFGFVMIVFLILVITCAEISVVMCYFQLVREDYRWWWRSFLTSGVSAVYVFLYAVFYFFARLEIEEFVPTLVYFAYTFVACLLFFLFTGTIGYCACFWFVRKAYSSIKVD